MAHAHISSWTPGWISRRMQQWLRGSLGRGGDRPSQPQSSLSTLQSQLHSQLPPAPPAQAPDAFRQRQVRHAVRSALARIGLGAPICEVAIKPGKQLVLEGKGPVSTYFVLVRLNEWQPEILLKSKAIEHHIQSAGKRLEGVRVTHVFWRFGSDVATPYDLSERSRQPVLRTGMPAAHTMAVDMSAETVPAGLQASDDAANDSVPPTGTRADEPGAGTTWAALDAHDPPQAGVWDVTQPVDLDNLPPARARKPEAVGFVRL